MFDQSRIVDGGVYVAIRARAKSIHVPSSCFGFQALNSAIGKHDLVQIAIGMAEGQFVIRVAVARRQHGARWSGDCAHLTSRAQGSALSVDILPTRCVISGDRNRSRASTRMNV